MQKKIEKIARRSIVDGVWTRESYDVTIDGQVYDFRDLAKAHGIELGNSKPKKQKQVNSYADMEQSFDSGDTEIDGDGNSEGSE